MPRFKLYCERNLVREFSFTTGPILIGRAPENDIVIDHESVSRKHAQIILKDGAWVVEKLPGRNPLVVNSNVCSFRVIRPHDKIEVWKYVIEYVEDAVTGPTMIERGPGVTPPPSSLTSEDVLRRVESLDGTSTASLSMAEFVAVHGRNRELMQAHLRWLDANREEQICLLSSETCVIGTGLSCDVRITGGMMGVTRYVAIRREGAKYFVEALSKLVGVTVNGDSVKRDRMLDDGDEIRVAKVRIEFREPL